ncbi:MAG: amidohydrolase family protein [Burkholderiales bacterium]
MFISSGRTQLPASIPCECCPPGLMVPFNHQPFESVYLAATRAKAKASSKSGSRAAPKKKPRDPAVPTIYNSIDVHHHIAPRGYIDAIGPEKLVNTYPGSRTAAYDWTPSMAIEMLDKGGAATAITSLYAASYLADHPDRRRLAREANEFAANMKRDYPGRFGNFAVLPMPDIDGSLREIEYALDVLKADGVYMVTSYDRKWLGHPSFAPVWEEMNRRKTVLYTHPTVPFFLEDLIADIPDTAIEINTDTTRSIADVIFSGTAGRSPNVDVIWSHGGGTITQIIERFTRLAMRPQFAARMPHGFMHEIQRFYYDVAQVAHPVPMAAMKALFPLSQILFGTDFTFRTAAEISAGLAQSNLSSNELRAIHRDNAVKLFPQFAIQKRK